MVLRRPLQVDDAVATYSPAFRRVLLGIGAFLLVYLLGRLVVVPAIVRLVGARNRRNPTMVEAVERYTRLGVLVVAAAAAAFAAGFGYLLAGSAVVVAAVTLAIGVAGQEVIGNLVSGLFLVSDPEFNVDDWIAWEDGEGVVETIRFRVTRVRTPNNEVITVPNTTLATTAVTRPYSRDQFRIVVDLALSTEEDIDDAKAVLREEMAAIEDALADPPPQIVVEEIDMDAAWLSAQFWIGHPSRGDVRRVRSTYITRVKDRLQAEDITFSPPSEHELSGRIEVDRSDSGS